MKHVHALYLMLIFSHSVVAQKSGTDSLIKIVQTSKEDSDKVNASNALSRIYWQDKNENLALYYSNSALALNEKLSIKKKLDDSKTDLKKIKEEIDETSRTDSGKNVNKEIVSSQIEKKQTVSLFAQLQKVSQQLTETENRLRALDVSLKDYKVQSNSFADASVSEEQHRNESLAIQQRAATQHLVDEETKRNWIIAGSVAIVSLLTVVFIQLYRRRQTKLRFEINQLNNKVLRSQLNPHFIFNALNSIRGYIQRYPELADSYLIKFSLLMRQVLENSVEERISLSDEIAMIENYMQLETLRIKNGFDYEVDIASNIDASNTMVPPLILQPMIENAIWHGLDPLPQRGKIKLRFTENNGLLEATVEDNGIGTGSAKVETKIARVKKKRSEHDLQMQLQLLRENLLNKISLPQQIILPNPKDGDSIVVPVSDVIRLEAANTQSIFYFFQKGKIEKTIYSLNIGSIYKKMLNGYDDFIMIHESHLINRKHITNYNAKNHSIKMADDAFIRIADRRVADFMQKFNLR